MTESPLPTHCIPSYASFVNEVFSPSPILRTFVPFLSPSGVHSVPPFHAALSPPAARSYASIGTYSLSLKGFLVLNYCYFSIGPARLSTTLFGKIEPGEGNFPDTIWYLPDSSHIIFRIINRATFFTKLRGSSVFEMNCLRCSLLIYNPSYCTMLLYPICPFCEASIFS